MKSVNFLLTDAYGSTKGGIDKGKFDETTHT